LLHNIFGRTQLILEESEGEAKLARELETITTHANECVLALDLHRDKLGGATDVAPLPPPEPALAQATVTLRREHKLTGSVLIVDDNADSRELLGRFLGSDGHETAFAANGLEALEMLGARDFDIVLLDLIMPGMNGLDVLNQLRCQNKLGRTFVIVMSGSDASVNASLSIKLGAEEYLTRPVNLPLLSARIDACLKRQIERQAEWEIVRQVQLTFLSEPGATYGPLRVRAFLEQAMGIGGDCYFHIQLRPGVVLAGVGDVTGKGLAAALDMARLTTLIKHMAPDCAAEFFDDWLTKLNATVYDAMNAGGNAVALTVALFDLGARRVQAAAFAQHAPLARDLRTGQWRPVNLPRHGFFGQARFMTCRSASFPMAAGAPWLLFSDGITEAQGQNGRQLALGGLIEALASVGSADSKDEFQEWISAWKSRLPEGARDDATLLRIEDETPAPAARIEIVAGAEDLRVARLHFQDWGRFAGVNEGLLSQLLIGCDEALTNIVKYAYGPGREDGRIVCEVELEPTVIRFVIQHWGHGIGQEEAVTLAGKQQSSGGLGLPLIFRVFSKVEFRGGEADGAWSIVLERGGI
jgi:CheY-like chemotaxis protein/anti-sigma regulatory factor (Ser/Thr protein kinase)